MSMGINKKPTDFMTAYYFLTQAGDDTLAMYRVDDDDYEIVHIDGKTKAYDIHANVFYDIDASFDLTLDFSAKLWVIHKSARFTGE